MATRFQSNGRGYITCDTNLLKIALSLWHNAFNSDLCSIHRVIRDYAKFWFVFKSLQNLHYGKLCRFVPKGGWSRFSRNVHFIIVHHMQCIVFADSAG